jgi:hypothetical protein
MELDSVLKLGPNVFELEILPTSKRFKKLEEPGSKPCLENLK